LKKPERSLEQIILLAVMGLFQVLWLVVRWILMPDPDWSRLPRLIAFAVGAVLLAVLVPPGPVSKIRNMRRALLGNQRVLVLVLIVVVLGAGGIYASLRPFHGDEPPSFNAAVIVATEGVEAFFQSYGKIPWLGRQHPPLMPLIYGGAMRCLGTQLWVTRSIALLFTAATVVLTYALGAELCDRSTGLTAALLMLAFPFSLHIGSLSNNDMPVVSLFALAVFLLLRLFREPTWRLAVATCVAIGTGMLIKYTMVFVSGVVLLFALVLRAPLRRLLPYLVVALLVSAAILSVWLFYAYETGALSKQVRTVAGYLGLRNPTIGCLLAAERAWRMELRIEMLFARLPSAVGAFSFPILLVAGWNMARRGRQSDLLFLGWVVAASLPIAVLLPDPRYFLVAFPGLALFMAGGLRSVPGGSERPTFLALCYGAQALYLYLVLNQPARILVG
jgi:4-amino-4-deoxy-L-arabinose transferase-like glycosyltransferase